MRINDIPDDCIPPIPPDERLRCYRASLKANAREALGAFWRTLGFAASPVSRLKNSLVVRIAWIYPDDRDSSPYRYYEPALRISIPLLASQGSWTMAVPSTAVYAEIFWPFFDSTRVREPQEVFSLIGLQEIRTAQNVAAGGEHPRTRANKLRRTYVRKHSALWSHPKALVLEMRKAGFYSHNAAIAQQTFFVEGMIEELRAEA